MPSFTAMEPPSPLKKECRAYVEAGGTLLAPRLVRNFVQPFGEWCEPIYGLVDFPPNTYVTARVNTGEYVYTFEYYVDVASVLHHIYDDGTIGGPVSGFGFSLDVDNRSTVSARYTAIDGTTFLTSVKYRCPRETHRGMASRSIRCRQRERHNRDRRLAC